MNPTIPQLIELQHTIRKALGQPAWIAGGSLRDIWHGRPVKDIDAFMESYPGGLDKLYEAITGYPRDKIIRLPNGKRQWAWQYQTAAEPGLHIPNPWESDPEGAGYEEGFLVLSGGPTWLGFPIQLIVNGENDPEGTVLGFGIDLCKIYIQGEKLVATPEFRRDSFEKRITVHTDWERETDHLDRVKAKYPGWRVRRMA